MKKLRLFIIIFLFVFGTTMALGFLSAEAWGQPVSDPPNGGFVRPVVDEGSSGVYYTSRELHIDDDFVSDISNFYVNTTQGRVGIGTNVPRTELEVFGGPTQLIARQSLPSCNFSNIGTIVFYDSMPRVCTSAGWSILQADIDGDGQY